MGVKVEVAVGSGAVVGVLKAASTTTSVGVGGTAVGVGVGSACWQAAMTLATIDDSTSVDTSKVAVRILRIITESRIRIETLCSSRVK